MVTRAEHCNAVGPIPRVEIQITPTRTLFARDPSIDEKKLGETCTHQF